MRRMGKSNVGWLMVLLAASLLTEGCSALGFYLGGELGGGAPGMTIQIPHDLKRVPPNTTLFVQLKDGSVLKGPYLGRIQVSDTVPNPATLAEPEQQQSQTIEHPSWIPESGAFIRIKYAIPQGAVAYAGRFARLDQNLLWISVQPKDSVVLLQMRFIQQIHDSVGRLLADRETILAAVESDVSPVRTDETKPGIWLGARVPLAIPFEEIQTVSLSEPGNGKWAGFFVGLAIDAAIVAVFLQYQKLW